MKEVGGEILTDSKTKGWAEFWKEGHEKDVIEKMNNKICPRCNYANPTLEDITTFPYRGNGYIGILGCKICKNLFYLIKE